MMSTIMASFATEVDCTAITTPLWGIWEIWCDFPSQTSPFASSPSPQSTNSLSRSPTNSRSDVLASASASATTWLDAVKSFGIIDTVEGFWGIHDCVVPPSRMPVGYNMFLFRHNVAPLWEHEGNRRGGKWVCQFDRGVDVAVVDTVWRDVCLLLIGEIEAVDEAEVCGCVVSRRRQAYKISLWTRHSDLEAEQMALGRIFRDTIAGAMSTAKSSSAVELVIPALVYISHCAALPPTIIASASANDFTPARDEGKRTLSSILYSIP